MQNVVRWKKGKIEKKTKRHKIKHNEKQNQQFVRASAMQGTISTHTVLTPVYSHWNNNYSDVSQQVLRRFMDFMWIFFSLNATLTLNESVRPGTI